PISGGTVQLVVLRKARRVDGEPRHGPPLRVRGGDPTVILPTCVLFRSLAAGRDRAGRTRPVRASANTSSAGSGGVRDSGAREGGDTMRAVVYDAHGGPEMLRIADVPEPTVGPDSVLVRVRAAAVNPVDWKIREGRMDGLLDVFFPAIPGWDVAGVVERPGVAAPEFAPGDEVVGYVREDVVRRGTFAEQVAAPVRTLGRKPAGLSWVQAAGLPLAGLTAYQALVHVLRVGGGDTVRVRAAWGGGGARAARAAAARGAGVIGAAPPRNAGRRRARGAGPVAYGDGLVERVRSVAPGGVTAVLDLVGGAAPATTSEVA